MGQDWWGFRDHCPACALEECGSNGAREAVALRASRVQAGRAVAALSRRATASRALISQAPLDVTLTVRFPSCAVPSYPF